MLLNLHVKDFALIEEAEVNFSAGLNIFTGETGAGKSILIDAVSSALGGRSGADVIRRGADSAYVELVFSIDDPKKREQLAAMDISTEYDCIVISRRIMPGRSVHKINDETVTSAKVRRAAELLMDIHGQHEHQSLLKKDRQLELLDQFAGEECLQLRLRVAECHAAYRAAAKQRESFGIRAEERIRRMDFLRYEIQELEEAGVRPGEKEALTEEYRRLVNFEKIIRGLGEAKDELEGSRGMGAADGIERALRSLRGIAGLSESLGGMHEQLLAIEDLLGQLLKEMSDYLSGESLDEERLRQIEARLDTINHLESKYGSGPEALERALKERSEELAGWESYEERLIASQQALAKAEKQLREETMQLRECRLAAIPAFERCICDELRELNFLHVDFRAALTPVDGFSANGSDELNFLISMNPGEELRPLARVASGGELSRIMLALKTMLAGKDEIDCVIFDEIDAGISGRTAQMVAVKLRRIGAERQVLCITHLPQIAAMADCHIGIEKRPDGGRTVTDIRILDEESSIRELARLLGGAELTEGVYRTAAEMKRLNQRAVGE